MIDQVYGALERANRAVALILGITLLLTVAFILTDVLMRRFGLGSLGGSDEISGYVMAAVASWGLGCALIGDLPQEELRSIALAAYDQLI